MGHGGNNKPPSSVHFNRRTSTTARRFGGTGLGLVISNIWWSKCEGQIGVESGWCQFRILVCLSRAEIDVQDSPALSLLESQSRMAIYDSNSGLRATIRNQLRPRKIYRYGNFGDLPKLSQQRSNTNVLILASLLASAELFPLSNGKLLVAAENTAPVGTAGKSC